MTPESSGSLVSTWFLAKCSMGFEPIGRRFESRTTHQFSMFPDPIYIARRHRLFAEFRMECWKGFFQGNDFDRKLLRRLLRRRIVRHKKDRFFGGLHPSLFYIYLSMSSRTIAVIWSEVKSGKIIGPILGFN